tara:strand:- start:439 stop:786 length:348 start_codon:yes stop_codon:yes gene_type:complete
MKSLYWCVAGSFMLLAIDFAISNQGLVKLTLWPLPGSMTVPVFILAFGVFTVSFFAGGFVAWVGAGKTRGRVRAAERKVREEEREIADLKRKLKKAKSTSAEPAKTRALVAATTD